MMKDHLLESNVVTALRYAARHSSGGGGPLQAAGAQEEEGSFGHAPGIAGRFKRGDDAEGSLTQWESRGAATESTGDLESQRCSDPTGLDMRMCEEGTAKMSVPGPTSYARSPSAVRAAHGSPPRRASRQGARSVNFGPRTST